MTIGELTETYRGKRVVDFKMGDEPAPGDVVYRLTQDYEAPESQRELLDSLLDRIDASKLESLIIGAWSEAQENSPEDFLKRLIERREELTSLTALFVGDMTFEECEMSWIIQCSYNDFLEAFPNLQSLRVRGGTQLALEPFEHAALQELAIETGGLPNSVVEALTTSRLPSLRHLELWLGDDGYGFDGDVAGYALLLQAIGAERLEYLGLRNSQISDELAQHLARQPWLGRLRTLDLSMGTIGDEGARALFESPYLTGLQRLDLSHHYISASWQQKLATLPFPVVLAEPQEEDDGDRYVAVAE